MIRDNDQNYCSTIFSVSSFHNIFLKGEKQTKKCSQSVWKGVYALFSVEFFVSVYFAFTNK